MASGYSDLSEIRRERGYGLNQKPPKINLLNERPRRESLVEQQLTGNIVRPTVFDGGQQQVMSYSQQEQQLASTRSQPPAAVPGGSGGQNQTVKVTVAVYPNDHSSYNPQQSRSFTTKTVETTQVVNTAGATNPTHRSQAAPASRQSTNNQAYANYAEITRDLAEKEAKLKREMAYLNQQLSPWARPPVIREPRKEPPPKAQRDQDKVWVRCPGPLGPRSRPESRASSTTEADLMEKTAKLLQDVDEIERKPIKTQQILIESGVGSSKSRSATPGPRDTPGNGGSIHTAIIKVPNVEVDNKSPLPFAYDNFSTLGVRGNIASVGAAPPESPYPPIFPQIKRTPSPMADRRRR